jgi:hypothetical protein
MLFLQKDKSELKRKVYSMGGISFSPEQLSESIKNEIPDLKVDYRSDFRQEIAEKWPTYVDDHNFKNDMGWSSEITNVDELVEKIME